MNLAKVMRVYPAKMKKQYALYLSLILVLISLGSCSKETPVKDKVQVIVSIAPLADFAREVGGDRVNVEMIVPPGSSPHIYEPSPSHIKSLHSAAVMVIVGLNLEFWKDKILEVADNPGIKLIVLSDGIEIIQDDHNEEHAERGNPHIWLSPRNAIIHAGRIRDVLMEVDPEGKDYYRLRAENYIKMLQELDAEIINRVKGFSHKEFIAYHAAWVYFARDYGLEQVAAIESAPGKEPSPAELRAIVNEAKQYRPRAIFAELQFSPKAAEVIAEECHCRVLFLDILGKPPDFDYIKCMRENLGAMEEAMK